MSKEKVGKLYRKRIVTGNKSEIDPHSEIHIDSLKGGGEYPTRYYFIDWDKADPNLKRMIIPNTYEATTEDGKTVFGLAIDSGMDLFPIASTVRLTGLINSPVLITTPIWKLLRSDENVKVSGFSMPYFKELDFGDGIVRNFNGLEELKIFLASPMLGLIISLDGVEEVTAEEYYS